MLRITRPDYGIPFRVQVDREAIAAWVRRSAPPARPGPVQRVPSLSDPAEMVR